LLFTSAGVLLLSAREARAQSISVTGIVGTVQRCDPSGACTPVVSASDGGTSSGVVLDAADCAQDDSLQFSLALGAIDASYTLQAWAGTQDCTPLVNRQAATAVCWPVALPAVAGSTPFQASLKVRDIVSQVNAAAHTVTYSPASDSVCQQQTPSGGANVSLYFFFTDSAGNPVGSAQAYPVDVDLSAEDAGAPSSDGGAEAKGGGGGGCSMNGASPAGQTWGFAAALFTAAAAAARRRKLARVGRR
jgi:hypothetical protein